MHWKLVIGSGLIVGFLSFGAVRCAQSSDRPMTVAVLTGVVSGTLMCVWSYLMQRSKIKHRERYSTPNWDYWATRIMTQCAPKKEDRKK